MTLKSPVTELKGVGEAQAKSFAVLGVKTVADLMDYYPRRYDDYSEVQASISFSRAGYHRALIKQAKGRRARRGMHMTEAVATDDNGSVRLVWFNQSYRAEALKAANILYIRRV